MVRSIIRVCILEDNDFMRSSFEHMIHGSGDCIVEGTFSTGAAALMHLPQLHPDVVLLDLNLGDMSGLKVMTTLKQQHLSTGFLVCSVNDDEESIFRSMSSGADGYMLKSYEQEKVISAIRDIYKGDISLGGSVAKKLICRIRKTFQFAGEDMETLSKRQEEILSLLLKGKLYKEIAAELSISLETVRKHVYNIYKKLNVANRLEVYNKVMRKELF